jgi:hypothetical protein
MGCCRAVWEFETRVRREGLEGRFRRRGERVHGAGAWHAAAEIGRCRCMDNSLFRLEFARRACVAGKFFTLSY